MTKTTSIFSGKSYKMLSEKSLGDLAQMAINNLGELHTIRVEIQASEYKKLWAR